jgi:hypothetical protein
MAANDPNLVNIQAAARGEMNAEMLDAVFMKAVVVPPKFSPTSKQAAQATGTARSMPNSANIKQRMAENGFCMMAAAVKPAAAIK